MYLEEEVAFLPPFFDKAEEGGILVVSEIKSDRISDWGVMWSWHRPTIHCIYTMVQLATT